MIKSDIIDCFQVYSRNFTRDRRNFTNEVNILVDKIWIKKDRIYFRIVQEVSLKIPHFRKEKKRNVYSIPQDKIFSIRCKLYF